jgi:transcriptional regulator with XRE-family HTH domain
MSMGEILKNAREQRGLSQSAVAEATHMKVQIIEDLEQEDFRRIAAPIYGRGFVKLYAEYLDLDPAPLTNDFMDIYAGKRTPVVGRRPVDPAPAPANESAPAPTARTLRSKFEAITQPFVKPQVRTIETAPAPEPSPVKSVVAPEPEPVTVKEVEAFTPPPRVVPQIVTPPEPVVQPMTPSEPVRNTWEPVMPEEPLADEAATLDSDPVEERWVVEPEAPFENADGEPDLFSQHIPNRQSVHSTPLVSVEIPKKKESASKRRSGPIFNRSRLDTAPAEEVQKDEHASMRQNANLKTFVETFKRLGANTISRGLSDNFLQQYRVALIVAATILVLCMLTGVILLFTMNNAPKKELTTHKFQQVAPIPALYAD